MSADETRRSLEQFVVGKGHESKHRSLQISQSLEGSAQKKKRALKAQDNYIETLNQFTDEKKTGSVSEDIVNEESNVRLKFE